VDVASAPCESTTPNCRDAKTPLEIAAPGTYVELNRATMSGGTGPVVASMTFTERGLSQLIDNSTFPGDGTYYYYITVNIDDNDPLAPQSVPSDQLAVTFDTAGPRVSQVTIATTLGGANASKSDDVEDGAAQLLRVQVYSPNQVKIAFDEDIATPAAGNLTLTSAQPGGGSYAVNTVAYDDTTFIATWGFGGMFSDTQDQIVLLLDDAVTDIAGNLLDGHWDNPEKVTNPTMMDTYPSGNGTSGDFQFFFTVMPGDTIGSKDNLINIDDLNNVRNNFGLSGPNQVGDADFDGDVDIDDSNLVRNSFGTNYTEWPGGAMPLTGGGGAGTSVSMVSQESTTSPVIGEEAMRQALRELYSETIAVGKSSPYDGLFGWDMLGDDEWWKVTLGVDGKA
jgi:hypothetical protein